MGLKFRACQDWHTIFWRKKVCQRKNEIKTFSTDKVCERMSGEQFEIIGYICKYGPQFLMICRYFAKYKDFMAKFKSCEIKRNY